MSEEIFSPKPYEEFSEEKTLVYLLKEKGVEDPEMRIYLHRIPGEMPLQRRLRKKYAVSV